MSDGGYETESLWGPAGWQYVRSASIVAPLGWVRDGDGSWSRLRLGNSETLPPTTPCSTSHGSKRTPSRAGQASDSRRSLNGKSRRPGLRARPRKRLSVGRYLRTRSSQSRPLIALSERGRELRSGCQPTWLRANDGRRLGSGRRPISAHTPTSPRFRTRSTPRCSSAPSTRCCEAARGQPTRGSPEPASVTGTSPSGANFS